MNYQMVDIVIIASNSIIRHPRIWKIVSSLRKRYTTVVLGWNREGVSSKEISSYLVDLTLFNAKAPFGKPSIILYYPIFWTWVLLRLVKYRPKVVHAIDLDTLMPSTIFKLIFRKKLVYDVHDRFAGYVPPKYNTAYLLINCLEELLSKRANVLLTVSERVLHTFQRRPKKCAIIMNCSEDYNLKGSKSKGGTLTLVYTGLICKDQGLEMVTAALDGLNGVRLVFAGRVADRELLDKMTKLPNVNYVGLLKRAESLELEASSDAMVVLYDLQYRKNQLSSPNKIFEAMMCGIPLITNMEQELVNKEVNCGIIVDYNNVDELKKAIVLLRDNPELRKRLGDNGRKAFVQKYNWNNMEKKLYEIYNYLLKQ
jgi:glycosyltransferase involved in cell wall biosynthesis